VDFDPVPRPRFPGSPSLAFYGAAPTLLLAAPELELTAPSAFLPEPSPALPASRAIAISPDSQATTAPRTAGGVTRFQLRLRSARGAPEALVVFPAGARVTEVTFTTVEGPVRAKLSTLKSGATLLDVVALPAAGVAFSFETAGRLPAAIQVFDQSYAFPEIGQALQHARPSSATSSQDGDLTVVHRTVSLDPAAGRAALDPT
jgi:hypothetical protein